MNELKPEDVTRALECCTSEVSRDFNCDVCPYKGKGCIINLLRDALALLREKDAEIERLQKHNTKMARKHYQDGRAEAIDEFAHRLKKFYGKLGGKTVGGSVKYHIDQIAKEMEGSAANGKRNIENDTACAEAPGQTVL